MKVLMRERDLSDRYIRFAQQMGVDGFDIHHSESRPGVKEQGYPDLESLVQLRARLRAAGLGIYRFAPPTPRKFLLGQPGGDHLHALGELAREQFRLAAGGLTHGSRVARMDVGRQGSERHDRQEEERQDEAQAQAHDYSPVRRMLSRPGRDRSSRIHASTPTVLRLRRALPQPARSRSASQCCAAAGSARAPTM